MTKCAVITTLEGHAVIDFDRVELIEDVKVTDNEKLKSVIVCVSGGGHRSIGSTMTAKEIFDTIQITVLNDE